MSQRDTQTTTKAEPITGFTAYYIKKPNALDPITIFLKQGDRSGQIIVECFGSSWSHYFGSISQPIIDFICDCDASYLAGKLHGNFARRTTRKEETYVFRIAEAVIRGLRESLKEDIENGKA